MTEELEKQLLQTTLNTITILANSLQNSGREDYKDYKIPADKPIPYYNALIDFLQKEVENTKISNPELIKFDKMAQERENMSEEELKQFRIMEDRMLSQVDSYLATMESRCTLKGNIYENNTIILRNRKLDPVEYPFGGVM